MQRKYRKTRITDSVLIVDNGNVIDIPSNLPQFYFEGGKKRKTNADTPS